MRKLLIRLLVLCTFSLALTGCRLWWPWGTTIETYEMNWYIVNNSKKTIYINTPRHSDAIFPQDTTLFIYWGAYEQKDIVFDAFYRAVESLSEWGSLYIHLKENDKILKFWSYIEKDNPGKQFYNEMYWTQIKDNEWIFEITDDDLE